jgi:hypothetical protein
MRMRWLYADAVAIRMRWRLAGGCTLRRRGGYDY